MHPLQTYYSRIHRTYDLVNRLFTFGCDRKWRNETVSACLKTNPGQILDLCCGTGDLAILLAKKTAINSSITGYDLNPEMLSLAMVKTAKEGLPVQFVRGDAANMPFENESFDCITIGFGFRNLTWENPARDPHLSEIHRVLKTGGRMLILESAVPPCKLVRFFYFLYLKMVLIPLGGLLSGDWNAYRYLAGSSAGFYSFEELQQLMNVHGFQLKLLKKYFFGSVTLLEANKDTCE